MFQYKNVKYADCDLETLLTYLSFCDADENIPIIVFNVTDFSVFEEHKGRIYVDVLDEMPEENTQFPTDTKVFNCVGDCYYAMNGEFPCKGSRDFIMEPQTSPQLWTSPDSMSSLSTLEELRTAIDNDLCKGIPALLCGVPQHHTVPVLNKTCVIVSHFMNNVVEHFKFIFEALYWKDSYVDVIDTREKEFDVGDLSRSPICTIVVCTDANVALKAYSVMFERDMRGIVVISEEVGFGKIYFHENDKLRDEFGEINFPISGHLSYNNVKEGLSIVRKCIKR